LYQYHGYGTLLYGFAADGKRINMVNKKHTGSVLLMLLVVIAIGLMIYYMDIMAISGGGRMIQKQEKPEDQPWAKENLIKDDNQPAKPKKAAAAVKSEKPAITKTLALAGEVVTKDAKRGQVTFTIQPDGTIEGSWQCQYSYKHAAYMIKASFKGNTDTTQNAPDDPSKLYLIAKGDYLQKATNLESGEVTETKGNLYFSGWLEHNLTASGKLSITTDKRWHIDYEWKATP
jgi:hypothetical protein